MHSCSTASPAAEASASSPLRGDVGDLTEPQLNLVWQPDPRLLRRGDLDGV
jgi:hypothetical protein